MYQGSMFLATLLQWYICSASTHRAGERHAVHAHGARLLNECTTKEVSLRTYWGVDLLCPQIHTIHSMKFSKISMLSRQICLLLNFQTWNFTCAQCTYQSHIQQCLYICVNHFKVSAQTIGRKMNKRGMLVRKKMLEVKIGDDAVVQAKVSML